MLEITVNGETRVSHLSLPTSIDEIDVNYLNEVTKGVMIGDDYSLIAIVYRESLSSIILAANQKRKEVTASIVPIFIRSGKTSAKYIGNIEVKDKIIIAPSDISMGHHISCPANFLSIDKILSICNEDKSVYTQALALNRHKCCFIEFKLVPNCNIHGNYKNVDFDNHVVNQFVDFEDTSEKL